TGDRFCPLRKTLAAKDMLPNAGLPIEPLGPKDHPPRKDPEKQPEKQPEKGTEKEPEKQPEKAPEDEDPRPKRVGFVNPSRFQPTTVFAQTAGVGSAGTAAVTSETRFSVTTGFLERIALGGGGRFVVLTAGPGETTLDVPAVRQGGFVYY